jgi:hypothetical protein
LILLSEAIVRSNGVGQLVYPGFKINYAVLLSRSQVLGTFLNV